MLSRPPLRAGGSPFSYSVEKDEKNRSPFPSPWKELLHGKGGGKGGSLEGESLGEMT